MSQRKPVLGLCGGIGAGKSSVAKEFERLGCLVVDSDELNHQVLRRPEILRQLQEWWGSDVALKSGEPNRTRIAERIFGDESAKRRLEDLVYPLIAELREHMIRIGNQDSAVKVIILDSPLLFESNLDRLCDCVVFVDASEAVRLERLQRDRGWDRQQLRRRETWQLPPDDKRARSEFVINNEDAPERLTPQVEAVLNNVIDRQSTRR
ncbi:MAG: dephospho-CoA kinase [Phycisphaerae bacterium]